MTRIYTQGQPIHWDCPECCVVCGTSYLNCVPPFATDTTVTGQYEITLTGLPPMFKPSLTKTVSGNMWTYNDGSIYFYLTNNTIYWDGGIVKSQNSNGDNPPCELLDTSDTPQDDIINENFLLTTNSNCTSQIWNGSERNICTGVDKYRLGADAYDSNIRFALYVGQGRYNNIKKHASYIRFGSSLGEGSYEYLSYYYPIYRSSDGYLNRSPRISISLDHSFQTIGTCKEELNTTSDNFIYGKGYCYSEWLDGVTLLFPYQYTVSGTLSAGTVGSSYNSSPRTENIQMFLGLLAGRGYNVVQREGSTEYYDVSYTQQMTATCTVKFTPSAS